MIRPNTPVTRSVFVRPLSQIGPAEELDAQSGHHRTDTAQSHDCGDDDAGRLPDSSTGSTLWLAMLVGVAHREGQGADLRGRRHPGPATR